MQVVWIIEDDADLAKVMEEVALRRALVPVRLGSVAELRENWEQCLKGEAMRPSLIISDLNLADGVSADILIQIRAALPDVKIVVQTASSDERILETLRQKGIPILEKPMLLSQLFATLLDVAS